nr:ATP-dependent DNA helicase RecG [Nocardiopsis mwathae]
MDEPLRRTMGDTTAKKLAAELDLHTVGDLLRHYPRRYATRGELTPLGALAEGEDVTVVADVHSVRRREFRQRATGRRTERLEVVITDGSHRLTLVFFQKAGYHLKYLRVGARGLFAGRVNDYRGTVQLAHPKYEMLPEDGDEEQRVREFTDQIIPIYPATKDISSMDIERCLRTLLDQIDDIPDPLPADLRERHRLQPLHTALEQIHRPADQAGIGRARKRLKWDEAFVLQLALARRRHEAAALPARPRPRCSGGLLDAFDARLPFTLTDGQRQVGDIIAAGLDSTHPMHRLLQGDVGAGKTLVALRAMLQVVDAGGQAVLLAPTEVLAQQHHRSISAMLGPMARAGQLDAKRCERVEPSLPFAEGRSASAVEAREEAERAGGSDAKRCERVEPSLPFAEGRSASAVEAREEAERAGGSDARPNERAEPPMPAAEGRSAWAVEAREEAERVNSTDSAERATRVALLTGSQGAAARREALLDAASGAAGIVVGTHALLQDRVGFADLGLVVVDEQHRFGVEQRDALRAKAADGRPHVLVMTATPIPRTVAMTVYGDLDVVALTQLPSGRSPVATHVVPARDKPHYLARAWERIREEVRQGRQAYVVCPRIGGDDNGDGDAPEESAVPVDEDAGAAARRPPLAVSDVAAGLAGGPLSDLRVAALHGRLAAEEKDAVMRRFAAGEVDVLVATTVIEVGVDVPNATVMAIMDADRFGVSQLHQLRGRVGRGRLPGLCLLVTEADAESAARERLAAVARTTDGFELSRVDLEQRREGDVLGGAQSGKRSSLKMLTLLRDEELIREARGEAQQYTEADPELAGHPLLAAALEELLTEERAEYLEKT